MSKYSKFLKGHGTNCVSSQFFFHLLIHYLCSSLHRTIRLASLLCGCPTWLSTVQMNFPESVLCRSWMVIWLSRLAYT